MDYGLAEAYKIIEDERCPQCGVHMWHAYSTEQDIQFSIEEQKCESCAVLDEHNDKQKDKKHGVTPTIKTTTYSGEDLPTRRSWFEAEARKQEALERRKKEKESH